MSDNPTCADCRWYKPKHGGSPWGSCRRRSPTNSTSHGSHQNALAHTSWPAVSLQSWCGEWENTYQLGQFIEVDAKDMPS